MNGKLNKSIRAAALKGIRKLKSNAGASLSFALLLFLVCSVIGAVVLTAATADAGRAGKMAETDQRYYSVTSAGELLISKLCGKAVTIERFAETVTVVSSEYTVSRNEDGSETLTPVQSVSTENPAVYKTKINGSESFSDDPSNMSFLTARAVNMLFGKDPTGKFVFNTPEAFEVSFTGSGKDDAGSFSITTDISGVENVSGRYELQSDGALIIKLFNGEESGKDKYTLVITLKPSFNETESSTSDGGITEVTQSGDTYRETKQITNTITKTSTIVWSLAGTDKEVI